MMDKTNNLPISPGSEAGQAIINQWPEILRTLPEVRDCAPSNIQALRGILVKSPELVTELERIYGSDSLDSVFQALTPEQEEKGIDDTMNLFFPPRPPEENPN